ncbi:coiled-coil domain-containing protein 151 [Astyanax mexicanus]|uniref:coiled-coil domain-containing protein 151 n=1 Tax=Astyanax mexicanus TaxID=7994 RepID=UPI0020CB5F2A|nr:coiled-coil domain-containing protein 151 [Astyanax mexicanus]
MSALFSSNSIRAPIHDQISELQRKIQLLEGERSAFFESSENAIKKNKETILQLREENRRLNMRLAHALRGDEQEIKEVFQSRSEKAAFRNMSAKAAAEVQDQKLCFKMKKLNAMKHTTNTLRQRLEELRTQNEHLKEERRNPKAEKNTKNEVNQAELHPQQHNVRMLENRLEKAQLKCQGAEHITKSYLKLKEHLQEESLTFEPRLNELEAEILRRRQELCQLQDMNHQAHLAKEAAKAELQQQEEQVYQERRKRELILNQYKKQVEERRAQAERGERRAQRVALHPDELNSEAQRSATGVGEEERVLSSFEEAFQHIREATGVTNTQEVVDRFTYQKDTQKHLEEMKVENEAKLQQLKEERDTLDAQFQEMKYSGETNLSRARQELEECESHLQTEQQRQNAAKEKVEWLTQTLSTVSAGVEHLTDKLQNITLPQSDECVQSDTDNRIVKLLLEAEHKLQHLQTELQDKDPHVLMKEMEEEEFHASIEGKLPQYNTRITLLDTQRSDLYEEEENSGEDEGDIITRTSLKRQSQLLIDSKTRRKTRLRKKRGKL